ncbi:MULTISPECIES: hypothetical protein [Bacillus]|uniref:hypothetical protein n=1 Tax=Bacillus TaxID=1386 RepID=UPI00209EC013|nr:hypothetical protein [Bacillus sp. 1663tsa1]MCP1180544.1 hypothetical protein [Bacillus sp. 1663tsa1]
MSFLEEHGLSVRRGIDANRKGYDAPIPIAVWSEYTKFSVAKSVVYTGPHCFDIATGAKIAGSSQDNSMQRMTDHRDDLMYGLSYETGNGYRFRAYDKNFQKVWECADPDSLSAQAVLTKDFIFATYPKGVVKISRKTGAVLLKKEIAGFPNTTSGAAGIISFGTNESQDRILLTHTYDVYIMDVNDLNIIKKITIPDKVDNGGYYTHGCALSRGVLHMFLYESATERGLRHIAFDINGTNFTINKDALLNYKMNLSGWQLPPNQAVQTFKKCFSVLHFLMEYKNGMLKTIGITGKDFTNVYMNQNTYVTSFAHSKIVQYGKIKQ